MHRTKQLLWIAAGVEALTGILAVVSPPVIAWLLFALPLTVGGSLVGRLAGIALISLAIAVWPSRGVRNESRPTFAMLVYNTLVALLFLIVGLRTPYVGVLLWVAFAFHSLMSLLFVVAWRAATGLPTR